MSGERPVILAVSGISGAGKTATVRFLHKLLQNSAIVLYDDYQNNYDNFLLEIKSLSEKNQVQYIIIEDPVGMTDSDKKIQPNYNIYIDTPLEVGLARVLLRAITNSSDKGIEDFYDSIGPQFESSYKESPTKLMHVLVWLLESYLNEYREKYMEDRERMKKNTNLIVDGTKPVEKIARSIIEWLKSAR